LKLLCVISRQNQRPEGIFLCILRNST
jgi:hypothetical protein